MTIDAVLKALELAMEGRIDEVDDSLIGSEEVRDTLTQYFADKETLGELPIKAPWIMQRYLALSPEDRREVHMLCEKHHEYANGHIIAQTPKNSHRMSAIRMLNSIHQGNALAQIAEGYIRHQPTIGSCSVSMASYFCSYDLATGKSLMQKQGGKRAMVGKSHGKKYYNRWYQGEERTKGLSFESWLLLQLPTALQKRLADTLMCASRELTLGDIARAYISERPASKKGLISFGTYCTHYAIKFFPSTARDQSSSSFLPGKRYHQRWRRSEERKQGVTFENWLITQLPATLQKEIYDAPHYMNERKEMEEIAEAYIRQRSKRKRGIMSLEEFSREQYSLNGHAYHRRWSTGNENKHPFDEWFCAQLSNQSREKLLRILHGSENRKQPKPLDPDNRREASLRGHT